MSKKGIERKVLIHLLKKELKVIAYHKDFVEKFNCFNSLARRAGVYKRQRLLERMLEELTRKEG